MVTYTLAGGCFWCLDAVYSRIQGVHNVVCGYTGGDLPTPSYDQVSLGTTGHAESVRIDFDETTIPKDIVLDLFFLIHDPTTLNKQGNDIGTQYRSAMFYADDTQKHDFEEAAKRAQENFDKTIVTEISQLGTFYPAEEYHQNYFDNNPSNGYCSVIISPKITKARKKYLRYFMKDS